MLALLVLAIQMAHIQKVGSCPTEKAHYTGVEQPSVKASFDRIKGRDELALHIITPKQVNYWFVFETGAANQISLLSVKNVLEQDPYVNGFISQADKLQDMSFYLPFDDDLRIRLKVPKTGDSAPRYFIIPELTDMLRNSLKHRESLELPTFRLTSC